MAFSYNKLWKLLIDKGMMKKDLIKATNMTSSTMAKLGKNQAVSMDVLGRICEALDCNIGDIVDVIFVTRIDRASVERGAFDGIRGNAQLAGARFADIFVGIAEREPDVGDADHRLSPAHMPLAQANCRL